MNQKSTKILHQNFDTHSPELLWFKSQNHGTLDSNYLLEIDRVRVLPENSRVVFFLKDASLPSDDDSVPIGLPFEVGGVAGAVEREEERGVGHLVGLQLEETVVHYHGVDCGVNT